MSYLKLNNDVVKYTSNEGIMYAPLDSVIITDDDLDIDLQLYIHPEYPDDPEFDTESWDHIENSYYDYIYNHPEDPNAFNWIPPDGPSYWIETIKSAVLNKNKALSKLNNSGIDSWKSINLLLAFSDDYSSLSIPLDCFRNINNSDAVSRIYQVLDIYGKVTSINDSAFRGISSLCKILFPNVSYIYDYAFNSTGLEEVNLPKLSYSGKGAFGGSSYITSVNLPNLNLLGGRNFINCIRLTEVNLPKVNYIGDYEFSGCSSLESLNLSSVTSTVSSDDHGDGGRLFKGCSNLVTLDLSSLTRIGIYSDYSGLSSNGREMFKGCSKLLNLNISLVTKLEASDVFDGCSSLMSIDFSNSIQSIKSYPFRGINSQMVIYVVDESSKLKLVNNGINPNNIIIKS